MERSAKNENNRDVMQGISKASKQAYVTWKLRIRKTLQTPVINDMRY